MKIGIFRHVLPGLLLLGLTVWAATARAAPVTIHVALGGAEQVPPVQSAASGVADLSYDAATRIISWSITCTGLSGAVTMAHFHGPGGKAVNAGVQIWLTKHGSPVENPIKGQATLTPEQAKQLAAGQWYINVHTQAHPGGEIRGQVILPKA